MTRLMPKADLAQEFKGLFKKVKANVWKGWAAEHTVAQPSSVRALLRQAGVCAGHQRLGAALVICQELPLSSGPLAHSWHIVTDLAGRRQV